MENESSIMDKELTIQVSVICTRLWREDEDAINKLLDEEYNGQFTIDADALTKSCVGFGVFVGGELVSMAFLSHYSRVPCPDCPTGKVGELNGVYTLKAYRHNGLATYCINHLIAYAKNLGFDYICADTIKSANELYYKIGFKHQDDTNDRLWIQLRSEEGDRV